MGGGWSGNAVTATSYNRNQLGRSSVMWCDKKDKLEMDCLLLLLTVTRAWCLYYMTSSRLKM